MPKPSRPSLPALLLVLSCAALWTAVATPGAARAGEGRWLHLFHIGHDESPNVVQYDLVVDAACRPLGSAPVKAYWRLPKAKRTRSLGRLERRAYGVEGLVRLRDGVRFHLAGRPQQTAQARAYEDGKGGCRAELWTDVNGRQAMLDKAWIETEERPLLRIPRVLFVDLFARAAGGERIVERLRP